MTQEEILQELASLPPEAQRQVADFIAFLNQRYGRLNPVKEPEASDLAKDDFIGIWRDREDMQDSSAWIREARDREWVKDGG